MKFKNYENGPAFNNSVNRNRRDFLALLAAIAPLSHTYAQRAPALANAKALAEIIDSESIEDFLVSDKHGSESWRIFCSLPNDMHATGGFPVLYLLDGNATFPIAWHLRRSMEARGESSKGLLLVGVGYPENIRINVRRRTSDFLPTSENDGRRDRFYDFLTTELPFIISRKTSFDLSRQALYGHSLAGLFAMHVAYRDEAPFSRICAADPSYWFGDGMALAEHEKYLARAGGQAIEPKAVLIEQSSELRTTAQKFTGIIGYEDEPIQARHLSPHTVAKQLAAIGLMEVFYKRNIEVTHFELMATSIADALAFSVGQAPEGSKLNER